MRAVVQRVRSASVRVNGEAADIAAIELGLLVLLGVAADDRPEDGERLAAKILALRIFDDERSKLGRTVMESGGALLVVPQFTLYADVRHGRRPDFAHAAPPDLGRRLFDAPHQLFASPRYLNAHGSPRTVAELKDHACVILGTQTGRVTWTIQVGKRSQNVIVDGHVADQ